VENQRCSDEGIPDNRRSREGDKEQLACWYRFLPSGETLADKKIMKRIAERFEKFGGTTTDLAKKIGM
jgi:hypothetical protein